METTTNEELWGEDLFPVFAEHINAEGWLTSNWGNIVEENVPRMDEHCNDNQEYAETYSRMYNLDFEESEDGSLIRPRRT